MARRPDAGGAGAEGQRADKRGRGGAARLAIQRGGVAFHVVAIQAEAASQAVEMMTFDDRQEKRLTKRVIYIRLVFGPNTKRRTTDAN